VFCMCCVPLFVMCVCVVCCVLWPFFVSREGHKKRHATHEHGLYSEARWAVKIGGYLSGFLGSGAGEAPEPLRAVGPKSYRATGSACCELAYRLAHLLELEPRDTSAGQDRCILIRSLGGLGARVPSEPSEAGCAEVLPGDWSPVRLQVVRPARDGRDTQFPRMFSVALAVNRA
jgi:hypothetical protein